MDPLVFLILAILCIIVYIMMISQKEDSAQ